MGARSIHGGRRTAAGALAAAVVSSALAGAAWAAERVALVIGNSAYDHVPLLANPRNDAKDVGAAFDRLGFEVSHLANANQAALRQGLHDFTRAASASEVAVVFYAGHGIEVDGRNFLVPVDAALARDADVEFEAAALDLVTRAVGGARWLGLVVLDACRDNPFVAKLAAAGSTRSIGRGLARVKPSGGTMVAYAAEAGKTADDDGGKGHSPYTEALLRYLEEPGLEVNRLFRKVRAEVERTTGGSQTPIEYGKLPDADIYLASGPGPVVGGGTTPPPPPPDPARGAYEATERVGTVAAFQAFLERYPDSFEATLAKQQIAKLEREADDAAFTKAKRLHTVSGYNQYLSSYPSGRHASEAHALLAEVKKPERVPGTKFRDCPGCPEMVVVPSGSFMMGSPGSEEGWHDYEGPVHRVTLARPFAVGVTEVTRGEFARFVSSTGRSMGNSCWTVKGGSGNWEERWGGGWRNPGFSQTDAHPVVCVSWQDSQAYVAWLSGETGEAYRLLSESEWEYVARAGTETARYWGESERGQCRHANGADAASVDLGWGAASCNDGHVRTAPVGSFSANAFGLHDVLGNVWEWVEDCWNESYRGAPTDGSAWESGDCDRRVLRGGSWGDEPRDLRSADRFWGTTGVRVDDVGFRVARTLTP